MEHDNGQLCASSLPLRRLRRVTLRFCLPYYTQWGQTLAILGSEPVMGSWVSTHALAMSPQHQGEVLYWTASLQVVPEDFSGEAIYSYCVVEYNSRRVLRRESGPPRSLRLPAHLDDNACVDIYDLWQVSSSFALNTSAVTNLILGMPDLGLVVLITDLNHIGISKLFPPWIQTSEHAHYWYMEF